MNHKITESTKTWKPSVAPLRDTTGIAMPKVNPLKGPDNSLASRASSTRVSSRPLSTKSK